MRHTSRASFAALFVSMLAFAAMPNAQVPEPNLRIVVVGGFLGYLDGLVTDGRPEGGVVGVAEWLANPPMLAASTRPAFRRNEDLLLIAGNNFPLDLPRQDMLPPRQPATSSNEYWRRFAALAPAAVGLSIDDFLRGLREKDGADDVFAAIRNATLPFVASNAVVRLRKPKLNGIHDRGPGIPSRHRPIARRGT